MTDIEQKIQQKLDEIEKRENVRVIYAVESGSRAWGFASEDSDYDVRFVYVRQREDYLKLEGERDVIEAELNEVYDISGWDVQKLLRLVMKSNPTAFEWASSPIVYRSSDDWKRIKEVIKAYFQAEKALYHYVSMAKNDIRNYFQGDEVNLKKYFYILRPALCCEYIMKHLSAPPVAFSELCASVLPKELESAVKKLIDAKVNASEKTTGHRIEAIDFFVQNTINSTISFLQTYKVKKENSWKPLNDVFLSLLACENGVKE